MSAPAAPNEERNLDLESRLDAAFERERAAESEEEPEEAITERPPQAPAPEGEAPPAESEEPKKEAEKEEPKEGEEPEERAEGDEVEIQTLDQLAEALEVDAEDLAKNLKIKVGEEEMTIAEAVERAGHAPAPAQMAAMLGEQLQVTQEAEKQRTQLFQDGQSSFLGVIQALISDAESRGGFSEEDLALLKRDYPEQWAVKVQERNELYARFDHSIKHARANQQLHEQRRSEISTQRAAQEGMKMIEAIPEWRDGERAVKEATEIAEYIQHRYHFSVEEMADMPDHRLALAFRDLFIADKAKEKSVKAKQTLTEKLVKAKRSIVPTRPRRAREDPAATKRAAARKRMRDASGDPTRSRDYEDAVSEVMEGIL